MSSQLHSDIECFTSTTITHLSATSKPLCHCQLLICPSYPRQISSFSKPSCLFPCQNTMHSSRNGNTHEVLVVALHESINDDCNIFNDIAETISKRHQSKWYRRVSGHMKALRYRMKETVVLTRLKLCRSKPRQNQDEGDIVCIDIDASLNQKHNVFHDIMQCVHQRHHVLEQEYKNNKEKEGEQENSYSRGTIQSSKKQRSSFRGFLRAAKRVYFTFSS